MLINYVPGEECRIAIARDDRLEEFYQERASTESHVGNIYKGRVTNIESSIQAAFIDFGLERNGFLHISDLHPMYFPGKDREEFERVGSKTPHRRRPPIQNCLNKGQEVLVQVLKEGIGTKGPTLTSYLSIPGRFLVMMPNMQRLGVSRRVDDDESRYATRKLLAELNPPEGFGFIVRTAGIGQTKTDLKRDLAYLQRLWKNIERRRKSIGRVGELYTESDLIIRTIRDIFSNDIDRVVVDDPTAARRAHDFLTIASPRAQSKVVFYNDPVPLFHRFGIEDQIDRIHDREVPLPSGGSLVIDSAEALVAIDVNSGKSRDARDAESNAFNTNKEAVDEIARQLRLRDLGGVIVNDLIDMRDLKHRKQIESCMRQALKNDRARTRVGAISQFGLLEMTRQRMRPSLRSSNYNDCHTCEGFGYVRSAESVVLDVMRRLRLVMQHESIDRIELTISPDVAFQLLNRKRGELVQLERQHQKSVMVRVGGHRIDYLDLAAYDTRGLVELETLSRPDRLPSEVDATYVELEQGELPADVEAELEQARREEAALTEQPDPLEALERRESLDPMLVGDDTGPDAAGDGEQEQPRSQKSRRRRRGGRGRRKKKQQTSDASEATGTSEAGAEPEAGAEASSTRSADESTESTVDSSARSNGESAGAAAHEAGSEAPATTAATTIGPAPAAEPSTEPTEPTEPAQPTTDSAAPSASETAPRKKTRKTRRKKKKVTATEPQGSGQGQEQQQQEQEQEHEPAPAREGADEAGAHALETAKSNEAGDATEGNGAHRDGGGRRKRRRRGGRRRSGSQSAAQTGETEGTGGQTDAASATDSNVGGYTNRLVNVPERRGDAQDQKSPPPNVSSDTNTKP